MNRQSNSQLIFDCHLHVEEGLTGYDININGANVIFNSLNSYYLHKDGLNSDWTVSLLLDITNIDEVHRIIRNDNRIKALKIHPRIQKINERNFTIIKQYVQELDSKYHIIIDAFKYGRPLEFQTRLENIIEIAELDGNRKIIVAHSGGLDVLSYILHLRGVENIYYDLSLSLEYLKFTSELQNFTHLIRVTNKEKILFGTDFPNISASGQLSVFNNICDELELNKEDVEKMLYYNSRLLFLD